MRELIQGIAVVIIAVAIILAYITIFVFAPIMYFNGATGWIVALFLLILFLLCGYIISD